MHTADLQLRLALVLADIRGSWGHDLDSRVEEAEDLAAELASEPHLALLREFREDMANGDEDGRTFRTDWASGGYVGHEHVHNLPLTWEAASEDLRAWMFMYLEYPEYALEGAPESYRAH